MKEEIDKAIRGKCISDDSADQALIEVMRILEHHNKELLDCLKAMTGDIISLKLLGHDMDDVNIVRATRLIEELLTKNK